MKSIKYYIIIAAFLLNGCNNEDFLKEVPLDIFTTDIAYTTPSDIVMTLTDMYYLVKNRFDGSETYTYMFIGTDVAMSPRMYTEQFGYGGGVDILPQSGNALIMWRGMYSVIKDANLVLENIHAVNYSSESLKNEHIAEARFFRGFAYRTLANCYGRVPIVLEVVSTAKRDYVKAETRDAVYRQAAEDLEFASKNLPTIDKVAAAGRVSQAAAYHLLSEVYISLHDWDKAIAAASWVVDNPNFRLMTERFGRRMNDPGTNVFWDMFVKGNVDYQAGNKETIWALQTEYGVPGGGVLAHNADYNIKFERSCGNLYWFAKDPNGVNAFFAPSTQNGGRPGGYISALNHVKYDVWAGNWDNDIRNAPCNIKRVFIVDNPASAYFGQPTTAFPVGPDNDTIWHTCPYWMKCTTPNDHPVETIMNLATGEMWGSAGATHKNWQFIRLAETYLLLAEAYLGKGDKVNAAKAINVVRNRAKATPVEPNDVNIDYILDERIRELLFEEPRRMTLMRLGLLYERTKRLNPYSTNVIQEYWNLLPIPYQEIERNTEAVLEQNPGYIN